MKEPNIKKNLLLSNMYQVLLIITPLITAPYISRVLGAKEIGIYSYTNSIQMYFSMAATLGTVSYGSREISRNRDDVEKRSILFWEIELLTILTTAVCLVFWGILILYSVQYKIYYLVLTLNLLAVVLDISWFYTGLERFGHIVTQNSIFKILGVIALFIFVKDSSDTVPYMGIMACSVVFGNLSMWFYLPHYLDKIDTSKLDIMRHFKETLVYFIPTIATSIYTVLDKTLIGVITKNEYENGYYEQASKITSMAKAISFTALNNVVGTHISYLFVQNRTKEIEGRIRQSIDYILFMGFGFCFGMAGMAKQFIPWFFGDGYRKAAVLLQMMGPLIVIIGISNCLGAQYYTPAGLRKQSTKYIIAGAVVNLIFNLIFIPLFSSVGAVIGSLIAETVITGLYLNNCNGYLNIYFILKCSWKKMIAACVMLVVLIFFGICVKTNFITIIVQGLLGGGVYCAILFILHDSFINYGKKKIVEK